MKKPTLTHRMNVKSNVAYSLQLVLYEYKSDASTNCRLLSYTPSGEAMALTLTGRVSTEALVSLQHGYDNLTIKFYNLLLDSTAVRLCFKRSSVRTNSARYQVLSTKLIQEL